VKSVAYHQHHGYVLIKKYDEPRQTYICKIKQSEEKEKDMKDLGDIEAKHDELQDNIIINARCLSEQLQSIGMLSVSINDTISSIKNFFPSKGGALSVIFRGEIVNSDDTFAKRMVKQGEQFILVGGSFDTKRWKRFNG
jgi:hypothetical protein